LEESSYGVEVRLLAVVHLVTWTEPWRNRISLHSARSVDFGWVEMRQQNLVDSWPKFTHYFCVKRRRYIVGDKTVFHLSVPLTLLEIFAVKV